jgi:hypothetical protein
MSLKARIARLEVARSRGVIEIARLRPEGGASLTEIRDGRILRRRELGPEDVARLARGAILIGRSYGKECADAA